MEDVLGYDGRRVIVTGAASGMGEATARILVELGAEVIAVDITPTAVDGAEYQEVDLRDKAAIEAAVAKVSTPVEAFFNCAGLPGPPFSDIDVMLVNFVGARHLIEHVLPKMPEGSAIAYVASNAGLGWQQQLGTLTGLVESEGFDAGRAWCEAHAETIGGASAYAFSKQVINAWVASKAGDYLGKGVRLNCTNPGPTETPMMPFFHKSYGKAIVDAAMGPLARYSTPEEQAWPLVFLNSPRLSYVTGEAFYVDGGFFAALQTGQVDFSNVTAAE
ncbi:MAG TPA: coniferyl-alcohol dehydrogenase [Acidimicrobiales bacterium]|nr:coniferyl-alcohol dehydrogenase [Acidimicrobiales bacterium]